MEHLATAFNYSREAKAAGRLVKACLVAVILSLLPVSAVQPTTTKAPPITKLDFTGDWAWSYEVLAADSMTVYEVHVDWAGMNLLIGSGTRPKFLQSGIMSRTSFPPSGPLHASWVSPSGEKHSEEVDMNRLFRDKSVFGSRFVFELSDQGIRIFQSEPVTATKTYFSSAKKPPVLIYGPPSTAKR